MKTLLVTILFLFSSISILFSQTQNSQVSQQWVARFNGTGNTYDGSNNVRVDREGNIYVSGFSDSKGGNVDFCVLKYNSSGVLLWSRTYDGPNHLIDDAYAMTIDDAGNVFLSGRSDFNNGSDMVTIKYNTNGDMLWTAIYPQAQPTSIAVDLNGNVFIIGNGFAANGFTQFVLVKYNSSGIQQWNKFPPGTDVTQGSEVIIDLAGDIYVTGEKNINTSSSGLWKYDTYGNLLWEVYYQFSAGGINKGVFVKNDALGNVYVSGESAIDGFNSSDLITIKYNSAGEQKWAARYNGPANQGEYIRGMGIDAEQNIYITGISYGTESGTDYATIKYNANGEQQWCALYNGEANNRDEVYGIAVDGAGNTYVTGWSLAADGMNCVTIKYNTYGVQQWKQSYQGPVGGTNCANSILVDSSGNVYAAGFSDGEGSAADILLIKYSQTTGINPVSSEVPSKYSLSQNYPNPFNPLTIIEFSLPENTFVTLKVFDIAGREMHVLVNENLAPGAYRFNFNGAILSSGTYFYKLETAKFSETKKMILVK